MATPLSPFLMSEEERARFLDLIRASRSGHLPAAAWVMDLLRKVLFACGIEYLAALAPMTRLGEGKFSLAGEPEARCWPAGADATADTRKCPGSTVIVEGLTGTWEDGNARQRAIAWGEAVAGRIWRRPDDPCGPQEAVERLFALAGLAILAERAAARGYPTDGPEALPFVPDAPPLAPDLPGDEPAPEASHTTTTTAYVGEDGPLIVVPLLVLDSLVCLADAFEELAETPLCVAEIRASGIDPEMAIRCAKLARELASRAIAGEWSAPAPAVAEARRRAEVVTLARVRRDRGAHLRVVPPAVADAPTAEGLKAIASTMQDMARAIADPAQLEALRAVVLRPDLLADGERLAARLFADADHIARLFGAGRNDPPPAA